MSGARTIEVQDLSGWPEGTQRDDGALRVRLCDGGQVLAERELDLNNLVDVVAWKCAQTEMTLVQRAAAGLPHVVTHGDTMATHFERAVHSLFPEFGTVPDGVETT